jgi:hypothetical protein
METLGDFLNKAAPVRTEFAPVANAINALNKVSHYKLSTKQRNSLSLSNSGSGPASNANSSPSPSSMNNSHPGESIGSRRSGNVIGINMPLPPQFDVAMADDFDMQFGRFGMNFNQGLQSPFEYMRTIEDGIMARNWYDH